MKKDLKAYIELQISEKTRDIVFQILSDPKCIGASILGLDVCEIIRKSIIKCAEEHTKEE